MNKLTGKLMERTITTTGRQTVPDKRNGIGRMLLSLFLIVAAATGAWADEYVWTFPSSGSEITLTDGTEYSYTSDTGGLTLTYKAGSSDKIHKDSYLYMGGKTQGSTSLSSRYLYFTPTATSGTITFQFAGTASGTITAYDAASTSGTSLGTCTGSADATVDLNVTGASTTKPIYLHFASKCYIKKITWTPSGGGGGSATLSSIAVKTAPTTTTYTEGETFDPAGLVITKTMSDASTEDVSYSGNESDFTFSPSKATALTTSNTSVTITYGGKSTTQTITVSAAASSLYTVTFDGQGKITPASASITQGSEGASITLPTGTENSDAYHEYTFTGWNTAADGSGTSYSDGGSYTPTGNTTLYAQYTARYKVLSTVEAGEGSVTITYSSTGTEITSSDWVDAGTRVNITATPASGYEWDDSLERPWGSATGTKTSTITNLAINDAKTFRAHFRAVVVAVTGITLSKSASSMVVGDSEALTATIAPANATDKTVTWTSSNTGVATVTSTGVVTGVATGTATITATSNSDPTKSAACVVTVRSNDDAELFSIDFTGGDGTWDGTEDFTTANGGSNQVIHGVTFRGQTDHFSIVTDGDGQHLKQSAGNAQAQNRWFAIPLTGINSRIDISITAPYASNKSYSVKAVLDTDHGTTVQTSASGISVMTLEYNDATGTWDFRIKDLKKTTGVLYIGRNGSGYPLMDKVSITTPVQSFKASPAEVVTNDGNATPIEVTLANNSAYNVLVKTAPDAAVATAVYNPSTSQVTVTPVGKGETSVVLVLDENNDGTADDGETSLTIPITVQGISITAQPVSAVYEEGGAITALSVAATNSGTGTLKYQWYSNTVNSNTGGTAISGATSATYTPTLTTEANGFYYCVVSANGAKSQTSDVAYVLYSNSRRYFQMKVATTKKTTTEEAETIAGQEIAGGKVTYYKGGSAGKYVENPTGYAEFYFLATSDDYYEIELPEGTSVASTDLVQITLNALNGSLRGVEVSQYADFSSKYSITTNQNGSNMVAVQAGTAGLTGATTIYVRRANNIYGYFDDITLSRSAPLAVTVSPASQSVQVNEAAGSFTAKATGGTGTYTYQWYQCATADGAFTAVDTGTGYDTDTFTPATQASATTIYYKVKVNDATLSDPVTYTVTPLTHGYYTPAFTDGKDQYLTYKDNYTAQNTDPATETTCYWDISKIRGWGTNKDEDATSISVIDDTKRQYPRLTTGSNDNTFTFYVKNAVSFSIALGRSDSRKAEVYVNDEKVGVVYATQSKETASFALDKAGSKISIKTLDGDIYIGRLTFYDKLPSTIAIEDNGETVTETTHYLDGGAKEYEVVTPSSGTITAVSSDTGVATASYDAGTHTLTVTPVATGTATITLSQAEAGSYSSGEATLTFNVVKHSIRLAFSYDKAVFKASELTEDGVINSALLPTLTATMEDGTAYAGTIKYTSDEVNVAQVPAEDYTVTYKGGQGGATIYAYIDETATYAKSVAKFSLTVQNGTSNKLPEGEEIDVYEQYTMKNSAGAEVVTITYGGFKYNNHTYKGSNGKDVTDAWTNAKSYSDYYIDGYQYYTSNEDNDASDEYLKNLQGMVGTNSEMWYQTTEVKPDGTNYGRYERIHPFNLPCRASYLKFEPKKSGILTAYVVQNGVIGRGSNANQLGSKPRLGYWFDQDGWVQHPVGKVISKQPVTDGNGRDMRVYDGRNLDAQIDYYWTAANDDADIIPMLRKKYCNNADEPTAFSDTQDATYPYENPYYWGLDAEVKANNLKTVPTPMRPVPYHNGYMMIEKGYVKYTLPVVAGKTYYFYGMMTKVGYVGMNFVEDDDVTVNGKKFAHGDALHLNGNDNMETIVANSTVGGAKGGTVYDEVTLPSVYRKGKWASICLPFALSENQVEEAFGVGTALTLYNGLIHTGGNNYTIKYLSHVDSNILPGQPYFIKPTGVDKDGNDLATDGELIGTAIEGLTGTRITFNTVLVEASQFSTTKCSYGSNADVNTSGTVVDEEGGLVFTGAYNKPKVEKYSYLTAKTGLLMRYTGETLYLNTYQAYLKPNSAKAQAGSMSVTVDFTEDTVEQTWLGEAADDSVPTYIVEVADEGDAQGTGLAEIRGKAHNLMGQEIDPATAKGIVVVNGKKYMFK